MRHALFAIVPALALALLLWPVEAEGQIDLTPPEVTRTPEPQEPKDTTPPELVGLEFSDTMITRAQVITIYAKITDDLSGFSHGEMDFYDWVGPSEKQVWRVEFFEQERYMDRPDGRWYWTHLPVPPERGTGRWHLRGIEIEDVDGNIRTYRYPFPDLVDRDAESAHADLGPRHTLYLPAVTR